MAEEFQLGRGNWWESSSSSSTSSSRNKFDSGISSTTPSAASTALSSMASNFDWPTEIVDIKATSSLHLGTVYPADSQKLHPSESSLGGGEGRGVLSTDPNLQMMGLGLPSQGIDWNQPFFRGEKAGSGFRSILQEGLNLDANYQQEGASCQQDQQWTQKNMYHGNSDDSSVNDYKQQMNRGITLDHQPVFNANMSSNLENASAYGSPSNMLQGLLISDSHNQESNFTSARSMYNYPPYNPSNCDVNNPPAADVMPTSSSSSSWSKFPPFLRTSSPPKQQWPLQPPHGQSHFSNSTSPFWNSTSASMDDVRSGFIPSLLPQITNPTIDEKPKHTGEVRDISKIAKKTNVETSNKRPRNEAPSPMPAFKVRKEKMGDRITALQQLVSPFGKTDTASVLSEAIEYIKFLHEQVNVLSTPYMKSGAAMQHHQSTSDKSNNPEGVKQQDLRSRGLCLVPVSSTFPVTHETTVDFWTPSFGGTFR